MSFQITGDWTNILYGAILWEIIGHRLIPILWKSVRK